MLKILLSILTTSAAAPRPPLYITVESARARLSAAGTNDLSRVELIEDSPGLLRTQSRFDHETTSARAFGQVLYEQFGSTLVLVPFLAGIDVPGFDGLVLDQDSRTIANFSLKTTGLTGLNFISLGHQLRRTDEFGTSEKWATYLLNMARTIAGGRQSDPSSHVRLDTADQVARFEQFVRASRLQREVFGVGSARPTWILIDARHWRPQFEESLAGLLRPNSSVTRIMVHSKGILYDLTSKCLPELTPVLAR